MSQTDKAATEAVKRMNGGASFRNDQADAEIITEAYRPLVEAAKETREAAAALMRAIRDAGCIEQVMAHMPEKYNGFGRRIDAALRDCVGSEGEDSMNSERDKAATEAANAIIDGWCADCEGCKGDRRESADEITRAYEPLVKAIKARANDFVSDGELCWCAVPERYDGQQLIHDDECRALRTALRSVVGEAIG